MSSNPAFERRRRRRYEIPGHARFLTFSCYQRLPLFENDSIKGEFVRQLAHVRHLHRFALFAWVIMPEHAHLLLLPAMEQSDVTTILRALKKPFAQRVIGRWRHLDARIPHRLEGSDGRLHFWQRGGGYDRNLYSAAELREKILYIDENPVRRGLVDRPEEWTWSSARWNQGIRDGQIEMDRWS